MTAPLVSRLVQHKAPCETRVVLLDQDNRPCRLFLERWSGAETFARFGSTHNGRIRAFADEIRGAFLELDSGEEAFLRLKTRDGLTEGASVQVLVESERRRDKFARVSLTEQAEQQTDNLARWLAQVAPGQTLAPETDRDLVDAAFEDALADQVTLPGGGHLHIERTRALTAIDVDTAGRRQTGSAGARALSVNRDAASELARQVALKGLGGTVVLDCIDPLNKGAREVLRKTAIEAFRTRGLMEANVLSPSPFGLMEISLPWQYGPLEDRLSEDPSETDLLALFRTVEREANAAPSAFFEIHLCKTVRAAYLARRSECDDALNAFFSGRVSVHSSAGAESRVLKR